MWHGTHDEAPACRRPAPDAGSTRSARRSQLVALGLDLIKTRPFDRVLIDEVIRAAGISKGLLFHYFPTKRDFQAAVIRAAADELLAALEPPADLPVDEQLRQGLDAYVGYIERHPSVYTAIVRGVGSDERLLEIFEETRQQVVDLVLGRTLPDPPPLLRLAVRGWIAMVEEATFQWLHDRECSRDALITMLERGALRVIPLAIDLGATEDTPA